MFGLDAILIYNQKGIEGILEETSKENSDLSYATYVFDNDAPTPSDLINEFSGWGDYIGLEKEEYLLLTSK